ncbi:MAG TPA: rhomboid family intramembrane serine protease [Verrucomicrobiae bacterium]|nr:rhomboid family intramembrane serine protease [Verrucomicrobiae bacterium]
MKKLLNNVFFSQSPGARLLLLAYVLGFPLAKAGLLTHAFNLYDWLGLAPVLVWQGQVWRVASYAFLAGGWVDWVVSSFWLVTLISVLGRNWTSRGIWGYSLLGVVAGALPVILLRPGWEIYIAGNAGMIFALLAAWDWFYCRERLILLGIGEISVRQAAILIAIINSIILFFCNGWFLMLAMWCGGVAGWLWLTVRAKLFMGKTARQIRSERVARLEL